QVAAPEEKPKAESRRDAAQSLLLVAMVIEFEKGLYKVRTHDCMSHDAAEAMRQRATDSGFEGAFVLNAAARPAPAPHVQKPPAQCRMPQAAAARTPTPAPTHPTRPPAAATPPSKHK